jgi:rod shape-determining protein MreD
MDHAPTRYRVASTVAKIALSLFAVVVVQGILTRYFRVFEYFDLPLIYSVYYGFTLARPGGSIAIGSTLGLLQDSLSGAALGTNGFSKTLIAFLAAMAGSRFDVDQSLSRVLAFVLFTLLDAVLKVGLGAIGQPDGISLYGLSPGLLALSAAFNVLFGMTLFGFRSRFGHATA